MNDNDILVVKPATVARSLVVSFTGMDHGKFNRWTWYQEWHKQESPHAYCCVKDDRHHFFLNTAEDKNYQQRLINYIKELQHQTGARDIITVGASMGGYAAIVYGSWLSAKLTVVSNPLNDLTSACFHNRELWRRKITEVGAYWKDASTVIQQNGLQRLELLHGRYPADVSAAVNIISAANKRQIPVAVTEFPTLEHENLFHSNWLYQKIHHNDC